MRVQLPIDDGAVVGIELPPVGARFSDLGSKDDSNALDKRAARFYFPDRLVAFISHQWEA